MVKKKEYQAFVDRSLKANLSLSEVLQVKMGSRIFITRKQIITPKVKDK